jgi:hypothetical protein
VINTATGTVTYTWPPVPNGSEQQVSVSVPGSPLGVVWTVIINGQPQSGMVGNGVYGAFYVGPGAIVSVTGTSLDQFSSSGLATNPGSAILIGSQGPRGSLGPIAPTQGGGYASGAILLGSSSTGTTLTPLVFPSANARGVIVEALALPILPPTGGGPANQGFGPYVPIDAGALALQSGAIASGGTVGQWFLSTIGLFGLQVAFAASTSWAIYEVDFDFDYPALAATLPVEVVTVSNPVAGADWFYTLPGPARLVGASAIFTTSATVASRYPRLAVGAIGAPMNSAAQTAGESYVYNGWPNAVINTLASPVITYNLPSLLLPASTNIQSITLGIAATDQWTSINLVFSGA